MSDRMIIIEMANLLKNDLTYKINLSNGYNYSYKKVYHNILDLNKEKEYPFIRYILRNDKHLMADESGKVEQREVELIFLLTTQLPVDVDNTNDLTIAAYKMREDIMGYMGLGDWIDKMYRESLTSILTDYGGDVKIDFSREYSEPYYSRDNTEVEIQVSFSLKYFQKLN